MNREERIAKALSVSTDTKAFELGKDNLDRTPVLFQRFFQGSDALIVADKNTWKAAGEKVYETFAAAGLPADRYLFEEDEFHADWKHVEQLDAVLDSHPSAVAVSVGSGTINDLCKLCSHHHGRSYLTIPTAASVDGYTSFGASITKDNSKQTFDCPAPVAVLADVNVLAAAPGKMSAAGYADLAAKVPAGAEWMIADAVGADPIIPEAWHVLQDDLDELLSHPEAVAAGEAGAVGDLFEGLILSGFAMQAARSSRPASCCDHLFSHILDMTHHRHEGRCVSHGFQVAIGTLTMCRVFEKFFDVDIEGIDIEKCMAGWPSLEEEQQRALKLFEGFPAPALGYVNIAKKYSDRAGVRRELEALKLGWPELRTRLQAQVWPYEKMKGAFKAAGAPYKPEMIGVTEAWVNSVFPIVQLMRFRYNLLDLAMRGGFYEDIANVQF